MPLVRSTVLELGPICRCILPDFSSGFPDFSLGLV